MLNWILLGLSVAIMVCGYLWRRKISLRLASLEAQGKASIEAAGDVAATTSTAADVTADAKASDKSAGETAVEVSAKAPIEAPREAAVSESARASGEASGSPEVSAKAPGKPGKLYKRMKTVATMIAVIGAYIFVTRLINIIFHPQDSHTLEFSIWPERVSILGVSLSVTVVYTWFAMAILIIAAVLLRFTVARHFEELPKGAQNMLEAVVEAVAKYTDAQAHGTGEFLCSYILTIIVLMLMSAFLELFRLRPPTADISMTFSLAFMTFILINAYGVKKKGAAGRIKSLASPTPAVFIFRVISEFAIPVSMACRLFGNMLGGMIVIDLLYMALGSNAVGIPSVAGLYFNVFHPMMQTFIFITLTLTFINEAIE